MLKDKMQFATVLLISIILSFSCAENFDTNQIDFSPGKAIELNSIGILNESGDFERLDVKGINRTLFSQGIIEKENLNFNEFNIERHQSKAGNSSEYYLKTRSSDNTVSISIKLESTKSGLALTGDTCKCETEGCAETWGCNASGSGSTCQCSTCSEDCKKTSSTGEDDKILG